MNYLFATFGIPLLAGFLFSVGFYPLRYYSARQSGYALILQSTLVGIIFYLLAYMLVPAVRDVALSERIGLSERPAVKGALLDFRAALVAPFSSSGHTNTNASSVALSESERRVGESAALALLLSLTTVVGTTAIFETSPPLKRRVERWALRRQSGAFGHMFAESQEHGRLIAVTLTNRKVYIGYVVTISNSPLVDRQSIRLWPLVSGLRDDRTLRMRKTEDYAWTYEVARLYEEHHNDRQELESYYIRLKSNPKPFQVKYDLARHISESFGVAIWLDDIQSVAYWYQEVNTMLPTHQQDWTGKTFG